MSDKTGGPAFPLKEPMTSDNIGMTMRDYFAAKALNEILHVNYKIEYDNFDAALRAMARESYQIADAMLAERDK